MNKIKINKRRRTIVITPEFMVKASIIGSQEDAELRKASADFPNFQIIIDFSDKN